MQARLIAKLSDRTYHFMADPPMVFLDSPSVPGGPMVRETAYVEHRDIVVVSVPGLIPRVVIHGALERADGTLSYGFVSRLVEGISNPEVALMIQGYVTE